MHEKIDECVRVMVFFTGESMRVHSFFWRDRKYQVEKIHMVHKVRDGADWVYVYTVSSNSNCYKLSLSTRTMSWRLLEIYFDG